MLAGLVVALLFVILATPAIMFPRSDSVGRVDAVVVLGPAQRARIDFATELVTRTGAGALIIATTPDRRYNASIIEQCERSNSDCFVPDPFTTRGEAAYVQELVDERGWTAVAVVTGTAHVTRARWIFDRCIDIPVAVLAADDRNVNWPYQYVYQTSAWVKAAFVGCVTGRSSGR